MTRGTCRTDHRRHARTPDRVQRRFLTVLRRSIVLAIMAASAASCERARVVDLAIVGANVIPMDSTRVLVDQTLLIDSGRIVAMGPSREVNASGARQVVDAGGDYVVPGLADMHVHLSSEKDLVLYVANGVTLVRNMWGSPAHLDYRKRVEAGELLGPTIVTAGPLVDGDPPIWDGSAVARTPEEGRRIVREQQAAGYDFIKVYSRLDPATFEAILDEAHKRGIPAAGHVPDVVPLEQALRAGMASIEHLTGFSQATAGKAAPHDFAEATALARRVEAGEVPWSDVYDPARLAAVVQLAASSGTWQVPTLIVNERIRTSRRQARALLERPEVRFMSPTTVASWNPDTDFRLRGITDEQLEATQIFSRERLHEVAALHAAGVRILAGTDAPNPHVLYGFSLHEELALLHEAGLSRFDALVAATRGPAEFLGLADVFGTVQVGRRADLVLAEGNPLDDLSVLKNPVGVVLRGAWHPRAELQADLEEVAASYAVPADWFAGIDTMALPAEVDAAAEYRFDYNGAEIGAVRIRSGPRPGGGRIVAAQSVRIMDERVTSECTIRQADDGSFAGASCIQRDSRGEHSFQVSVADGKVVLDGKRASGEPIADTVALGGPAVIELDPLVPGLGPVVRQAAGLAVGGTTRIDVIALDNASGAFRLVPEAWSLVREPDRDAHRVIRADVHGEIGDYSVEIEADGGSVSRAVFTYQMGVLTVRKQGGG